MNSKDYSTREAAKAVGISRATLQAWIANGKIKPPQSRTLGNVMVRIWTKSDLARLRKSKERIYWKGQGRPRKRK